jgi:hypothetical protein
VNFCRFAAVSTAMMQDHVAMAEDQMCHWGNPMYRNIFMLSTSVLVPGKCLLVYHDLTLVAAAAHIEHACICCLWTPA